jgi:hypothetical protein
MDIKNKYNINLINQNFLKKTVDYSRNSQVQKSVREKRLQGFVRILGNKYNIELKIVNLGQGSLGFCDSTRRIFIEQKIGQDEVLNLILQKCISLHELGHILFTKSSAWKGISHTIANIIEDGRVEEAISRLYPKARQYFVFMNNKLVDTNIDWLSQPIVVQLLQLMLTTIKKTTGMQPLPTKVPKNIKKFIGEDNLNWFIEKTIEALNINADEDAAKIGMEIEEKILELLGIKINEMFLEISMSDTASVFRSGSYSRKMPKKIDDDLEKILSENEREISGIKTRDNNSYDEPDSNKIRLSIESILKRLEDEISVELKREKYIINYNGMKGDFSSYNIDKNSEKTKWYRNFTTPVDVNQLDRYGYKMSYLFKSIAGSKKYWGSNQKKGMLEIRKVTSILAGDNQPKIFKKKVVNQQSDLSVVLLLDGSGSMIHRAKVAIKSSYIVCKALELCHYNSEIVVFGVRNTYYHKDVFGIKAFNQKLCWAKDRFCPYSIGNTPLLRALRGAHKSLMELDSKRKLVIVITDGEPNNVMACKKKIIQMEKHGILVAGILIRNRDLFKIFSKEITCYNVDELSNKMSFLIKKILKTINKEV